MTLNHLLFADDLVIIIYSYDIMIELQKIFNIWSKDFKMQLSVEEQGGVCSWTGWRSVAGVWL